VGFLSSDLLAFGLPVSASAVTAASGNASIAILDLGLQVVDLAVLLVLLVFEVNALFLELFVSSIFGVFFFAQGTELLFQKCDLLLLGLHESSSQVFDHSTELVLIVVRGGVFALGLEVLDDLAGLHALFAHDETTLLVACRTTFKLLDLVAESGVCDVGTSVLALGLEVLDDLAGLHALFAHEETTLLEACRTTFKLLDLLLESGVCVDTHVRTLRHGAFVS